MAFVRNVGSLITVLWLYLGPLRVGAESPESSVKTAGKAITDVLGHDNKSFKLYRWEAQDLWSSYAVRVLGC